jgi:hypothetical protein
MPMLSGLRGRRDDKVWSCFLQQHYCAAAATLHTNTASRKP